MSEFDFLNGFFRFFTKTSPLLLWSLLETITSESSSEPKILRLTLFFLMGQIKCCTFVPSCCLYMFLIIYSVPKKRNSDYLMKKKTHDYKMRTFTQRAIHYNLSLKLTMCLDQIKPFVQLKDNIRDCNFLLTFIEFNITMCNMIDIQWTFQRLNYNFKLLWKKNLLYFRRLQTED